ncbi:MAG: hypothetical protein NVS4B1_28730 [Ktedonobacteraceae bacterium]
MGSEYMGPVSDPDKQQFVHSTSSAHTPPEYEKYEEPSYREHVTQPLGAPGFQPVPMPYSPPQQSVQPQQPYQQSTQPQRQQGQPQYPPAYPNYAYPGQPQPQYGNNGFQQYQQPQYNPYNPYNPGYAVAPPGYPPYYGYVYPVQPVRASRDRYLFVITILAVVGSSLATLGGLASAVILLLISLVPSSSFSGQRFSGLVLFVALAIAGCLGGSFGLFHSIRSLLRKPSSEFKLPGWWIFLACYVVVIGIAAILRANGLAVANLALSVFLIAFAGVLPALTILSLGVRRLHFPRSARWPTRWRRFAVAIASGATLAIVLALIFETILQQVAAGLLRTSSGFSLDNPNQPLPSNPSALGFLFVLVSVIAPLVEEAVKPLAVVAMIGRIESAAEAFVLGLSCGIGFDLIETSGYISSGYQDWLNVALQRSTAGLLHGLGAAMVSLGWYYLTHPKASHHRFLFGFGCMLYAVLQHAIWNGSFVLQLLPAPIGPYLTDGVIGSGSFAFPAFLLVYVVESILMLTFFIFITGKIRTNNTLTPPTSVQSERLPAPHATGGLQHVSGIRG